MGTRPFPHLLFCICEMMRYLFPILFSSAVMPAFAAGFTVDRIDPPHWWVGMKDTSLQLQVHGRDVRLSDFTVDFPGVAVDSVVRLDGSPDWQYVYLRISPEAKPADLAVERRSQKSVAEL